MNKSHKFHHIFVLNSILKEFFGEHYPREIVSLIIRFNYVPLKIYCGRNYTIFMNHTISVYGPKYVRKLKKLDMRDIKSIHSGSSHIIVQMLTDNKTYGWGTAGWGQLGQTYTDEPHVLSLGLNIILIGCGDFHTIILEKYDIIYKLYSCGCNNRGQLGLGHFDRTCPAQEINLNINETNLKNNIMSIKCGAYHTIVLISNKCYVWGANEYGQLGIGDFNDRTLPRELMMSNIIEISCGEYHTGALVCNKGYIWGKNNYGQLGLGDNQSRNLPQELSLPNLISLKCGRNHTMALTRIGKVYIWGDNEWGN